MNTRYVVPVCSMEEYVTVSLPGHSEVRAVTMDVSDGLLRMRLEEPPENGALLMLGFDFVQEDRTTERMVVPGVVTDRFKEPEHDQWQVGVRLEFGDPVAEIRWQSQVSSCRGIY